MEHTGKLETLIQRRLGVVNQGDRNLGLLSGDQCNPKTLYTSISSCK